jgi:hypothetical protein
MNVGPVIPIESRDFWVKVVGMLQQNWALSEPESTGNVRIHFVSDTGGVFDSLLLPSEDAARAALMRNGFSRYADDPQMKKFLFPPEPPFHQSSHPNGPIYSSGRHWK